MPVHTPAKRRLNRAAKKKAVKVAKVAKKPRKKKK